MAGGQSYSDMQWYLAHTGTSVHFATYLERAIAHDEVVDIVRHLLATVPGLRLREDNENQQLISAEIDDPGSIVDFAETSKPMFDLDDLPFRKPELASAGEGENGHRFQVWCRTSKTPNEHGHRTLLAFMAGHSHIEGADLSFAVRGKNKPSALMNFETKQLTLPARLAVKAALPLVTVLHLAGAHFRKDPTGPTKFASITLDGTRLRRFASRHGVSRRSAIFGLVSHGFISQLRRREKAGENRFTYSVLFDENRQLDRDDPIVFNLRDFNAKAGGDLENHLADVHHNLTGARRTGIATEHLMYLLQWLHRRLNRFLPGLYGKRFKTYSPYDMILSLLPPVLPSGMMAAIGDGPFFAGSYTSACRNCIIVPSRKTITLNLFVCEDELGLIEDFRRSLGALGLLAEADTESASVTVPEESDA